MFDLVTGKARHLPSHSTLPILLSTTAQAAAAAVALAVPALFVVEQIPETPTMLAFVAPPPPLPPSPPPPRSAAVKPVAHTQPATSPGAAVTPVEVPNSIQPEPSVPFESGPPPGPLLVDDGVPGGVEGGIPDGIAGGVVGGLPEPPPAPPTDDRAPVRIGGTIQAPRLLRRVEPAYPPIAVSTRLQGLVILEALVDRDGMVDDVRVLRSAGPVLDREALIAVRQWRYSPLILNGQRKRFVLTVMLLFAVETDSQNLSYAVRAK